MDQEHLVTALSQQTTAKLELQRVKILEAISKYKGDILTAKRDLKIKQDECNKKKALFEKKQQHSEKTVFSLILAFIFLIVSFIGAFTINKGFLSDFYELESALKIIFLGMIPCSAISFIFSGVHKIIGNTIKVKQDDIDADQASINSDTQSLNNLIINKKHLDSLLNAKNTEINNMINFILTLYSILVSNPQASNNEPTIQQPIQTEYPYFQAPPYQRDIQQGVRSAYVNRPISSDGQGERS